MGNRVQLQMLLETLSASPNVYFQPPETKKIVYPCIVYDYDFARTIFANDKPYRHKFKYTLTVIDKNPDSALLEKILTLPMCTFDRHYTADNLNHFSYSLYY